MTQLPKKLVAVHLIRQFHLQREKNLQKAPKIVLARLWPPAQVMRVTWSHISGFVWNQLHRRLRRQLLRIWLGLSWTRPIKSTRAQDLKWIPERKEQSQSLHLPLLVLLALSLGTMMRLGLQLPLPNRRRAAMRNVQMSNLRSSLLAHRKKASQRIRYWKRLSLQPWQRQRTQERKHKQQQLRKKMKIRPPRPHLNPRQKKMMLFLQL